MSDGEQLQFLERLSKREGLVGECTFLELFGNVRCTSSVDLALADGADLLEELWVCRHLQLKDGVYNGTTGGNVTIPFPAIT